MRVQSAYEWVGGFPASFKQLPHMPSDTENRPSRMGGTNAEKITENRGGATRGPAGTIRRVQNTAPDGAGPDLIQAVALRACSDDTDPNKIWASIQSAAEEIAVQFELSHSTVAVQASPVGLIVRFEHESEPVEYALLADDTARALTRIVKNGGGD